MIIFKKKVKEIIKQREWSYHIKRMEDIPHKPGIYIIDFRNKKHYVGASLDLRRGVREHLQGLIRRTSDNVNWYKIARDENSLPLYPVVDMTGMTEEQVRKENDKYTQFLNQNAMRRISISFCACDDYEDYKNTLLKAVVEENDKDMWYNSVYSRKKRGGVD